MFMKVYSCFLFLNAQDKVGTSISSSVILYSFVLLVYIVGLVLVFYLCPSCVRVITYPGDSKKLVKSSEGRSGPTINMAKNVSRYFRLLWVRTAVTHFRLSRLHDWLRLIIILLIELCSWWRQIQWDCYLRNVHPNRIMGVVIYIKSWCTDPFYSHCFSCICRMQNIPSVCDEYRMYHQYVTYRTLIISDSFFYVWF
jgi:hypothetical protein